MLHFTKLCFSFKGRKMQQGVTFGSLATWNAALAGYFSGKTMQERDSHALKNPINKAVHLHSVYTLFISPKSFISARYTVHLATEMRTMLRLSGGNSTKNLTMHYKPRLGTFNICPQSHVCRIFLPRWKTKQNTWRKTLYAQLYFIPMPNGTRTRNDA